MLCIDISYLIYLISFDIGVLTLRSGERYFSRFPRAVWEAVKSKLNRHLKR
jgi:hypothetical protein